MRTSCEPAPARLQRERPKNTTAKTELPKQHQGVLAGPCILKIRTASRYQRPPVCWPDFWATPCGGHARPMVVCSARAHTPRWLSAGGARPCLQSKGLYCRVLSHAALIQNRQIVREGRLSAGGECAGGVSRGGVCIAACSPMSKRAALRAVVCIAVTAGCAARLPHASRAPRPPAPLSHTQRTAVLRRRRATAPAALLLPLPAMVSYRTFTLRIAAYLGLAQNPECASWPSSLTRNPL